MAPPSVTWEAVAAWSALTFTQLMPWEAKAVVTLGAVRVSIQAEELSRERQKQKQTRRVEKPPKQQR